MKRKMMYALMILVSQAGLKAQVSETFVHRTTDSNVYFNESRMSKLSMDFKNNSILLLTHNHNPKGNKALFHNHNFGTYYSGGYWRIFNEDKKTMDTGMAFNVMIPGGEMKAWIHTADSVQVNYNWTAIDHGYINGDPNAHVFISNIWNPGGVIKGIYNDNVSGVYYNTNLQKWCIFYEDISVDMVPLSSYAVVVPEKSSATPHFVHRAVQSNILANSTLIDHPDANGNPEAKIFITQNWNPNGGAGKYNKHRVGVFYNGSKWAIYNEDEATMDTGVSFNVMIYAEKTNSIKQEAMNSQIHLFPNPVQNGNMLEIGIDNSIMGIYTIEISDINGRKLLVYTFNKDNENWKEYLPVNELSKGIYFLQVKGEGFGSTQKFVIE